MGELLAPHQLGFGIPPRAEAALYAGRTYLSNLQPGHLILKLDFKNVFNSLRRDKMMLAVKELISELLPWVLLAYESSFLLFYGKDTICSAEGVHQGDPLAPLLFCLTINSLVEQLCSKLNIWYLDDSPLGGRQDFRLVEDKASKLGIVLNHSKSEVITKDDDTRHAFLQDLPDLCIVCHNQATLLGSPIGGLESINTILRSKLKSLGILGHKLQYLSSHDAFCLLRNALAIPKVLYVLRTSPCFLSAVLNEFNNVLREILSKVLNITLNALPWATSHLPGRAGALGICSSVMLAPSAYLASAAG